MTIADKIDYFQTRARQEREIAAAACCEEARRAHLGLALEHERAADRERSRLAGMHAAPTERVVMEAHRLSPR